MKMKKDGFFGRDKPGYLAFCFAEGNSFIKKENNCRIPVWSVTSEAINNTVKKIIVSIVIYLFLLAQSEFHIQRQRETINL